MKTMLCVALVVIGGSVVLAAINSSPNTSGTTLTPTDPNGTLTTGTTQTMTMTNQPNSMVGSNGVVPAWSNQTPPIVAINQLSPGQPIPMNQ